jgi:hypothetical protein
MSSLTQFTKRFNHFLYRQHLRKLGPEEIESARAWCLAFIRREHPHFTEAEIEHLYENLIHIKIIAVDGWAQRMN